MQIDLLIAELRKLREEGVNEILAYDRQGRLEPVVGLRKHRRRYNDGATLAASVQVQEPVKGPRG